MSLLLGLANVTLFFSRFVHSGRVCSGDYLDLKSETAQGYLISQGSFIQTYASILSIVLYFLFCGLCFISARRTAAETRKREQQHRDQRLANM